MEDIPKTIKQHPELRIEEKGDYVLIPRELWESINHSGIDAELPKRMDIEVEDIGDLIRVTRLSKGMSKKEFAKATGLLECQVSNFERKQKKPRYLTIEKIASFAGAGFIEEAKGFL